jgi:hypothetical protein
MVVALHFGPSTSHIPCPLVGSHVTVVHARTGCDWKLLGCLSADICGVRVEDAQSRRAMGCPAPAAPPSTGVSR